MVFTDVRLQHYRSYTDASFELGPGVTIVVGPNTAGKTNLLEAIMVASVGKSYRSKDIQLLQAGQSWARIDVHTNTNTLRTVKLQTNTADRLEKQFEIDGKAHKRLPLASQQPIVLFEPNNLQLVEGEPSKRREYVDDLIEQYVSGYETVRQQYKRTLLQRNTLLKRNGANTKQLFAWNLRLVELAEQIVQHRLATTEAISNKINDLYKTISNKDKQVRANYETTVDTRNYSSDLMRLLEINIDKDAARGFTGNGPHRDDFVLYFGNDPAIVSASRGELRTLVLTLKIIELEILEKERGNRPLLLLDDVFSELDGGRRHALTDFLKDHQTILTTTDADIAVEHFSKRATVIAV